MSFIAVYQTATTMISEIFDFSDQFEIASRSFIISQPRQNSPKFPGLTDCLHTIECQYGFQGDAAVLVLTWAIAANANHLDGQEVRS